jgi:hypothetical protein
MNDGRHEPPREEWRELFEKLTNEFDGYDVTIEVVGEQLGDHLEAEGLPLAYLAYDDKDDVFIVAVGGRDGRYPELHHMIDSPQRILADSVSPDVPWAIDVTGPGTQTIVSLRRPAA